MSLASNVQTCCRTWRPIGNGVCHPLARTDTGRECSHEVMRISFNSVYLCIATARSLGTQTRLQFHCESRMRCFWSSMEGYMHKVRYLLDLLIQVRRGLGNELPLHTVASQEHHNLTKPSENNASNDGDLRWTSPPSNSDYQG